jgi:hypothetical protein
MVRFSSIIFNLFVFLSTLSLSASDPVLRKIDPQILKSIEEGAQMVEYIIYHRDQAKLPEMKNLTKKEKGRVVFNILKEHAERTQQSLIQILRSHQATYRSYFVANAIWVKSDTETMMKIAAMPEAASIIHNPWIKMQMPEENRLELKPRNPDPEWGIKKIQADEVWQMGFTGQGITIAGQDTGYEWDLNPLKSKYRGWDGEEADHNYQWHDAIFEANPRFPENNPNPCGLALKAPCDDNNHGTHTMGTMVGSDEENLIGVAPDARWMACRNMDRGWGKPSTYMECFEFFLAPHDLEGSNPDPEKAPHVINNSWGCPEDEGCNPSNWALMEQLVINLKSAGIMVVVSAGNSGNRGCGSIDNPAAMFEPSFTVGSTRQDDAISGFSSRGPVVVDSSYRMKPDVVAPGSGVRSVIRGGFFASYSGTSMAGPHVAGVVALMLSANPALEGRVEDIEDILRRTAVPFTSNLDCFDFPGADVPNTTFGWGRIDALEAVKMALEFTSSTNDVKAETQILCFPNPGSGIFHFTSSNPEVRFTEIRIFDYQSRQVFASKEDIPVVQRSLDLSHLPAGMYFFKMSGSKFSYSGKLIKL